MKLRQEGKVVTRGSRRNGPVTTEEMAEKAAEGVARGLSARWAPEEAGFPPSTVRNSTRGINKTIWAKFKGKKQYYIELGRDHSRGAREAEPRPAGMDTIVGTDKGVMSAKQLGADKRIAMWQPISQVGMVVIKAPEVPKIGHRRPASRMNTAYELPRDY
jgi:hypothetical protein